MGSDEAVFVLDFERGLEEAVHESKGILLVLEDSAAINALQVDVEESFLLAALDEFLDLGGFLGEEGREVNRLHGVDGDLLAAPFNGLWDLGGDTHDY